MATLERGNFEGHRDYFFHHAFFVEKNLIMTRRLCPRWLNAAASFVTDFCHRRCSIKSPNRGEVICSDL